jgi:hypothetical protein
MSFNKRYRKAYKAKISAKRMQRRKLGLFKKAYTFLQDFDINMVVILYKNG